MFRCLICSFIFVFLVNFEVLAETKSERCLRASGVSQADLALEANQIRNRKALRDQIKRDMALSRSLKSNGCISLSQLFRQRSESLRPALRNFTRNSNQIVGAINVFQAASGAFIATAPSIYSNPPNSGSEAGDAGGRSGRSPTCREPETTCHKSMGAQRYNQCIRLPKCRP